MKRTYQFLLATSLLSTQAASQSDSQTEKMEVTGTRLQKTKADEVSKIEISADQAALVAPSGDVAQVPKLFPGTISRPQESEVSIRGSDADDALYYVDDILVENIFEPLSGTSVVPTKAIDTLEFYPGNFDAEYGDSTSGIIRLNTRDVDIVEPYSEFRLNLPVYTSGYHEQEIGSGSMILSVRKSIIEPFVKAVVQEDGQVILPYFEDAYLQYYYDGDETSVKARVLHSHSGAELKVFTDRSTSTDGTSEFNFDTKYTVLGLDIITPFLGQDVKISPSFRTSAFEFSTNDISFNLDVDSITIPIRTQYNLAPKTNLFLGLQTTHQMVEVKAVLPSELGQDEFSESETSARRVVDVKAKPREDAAWASLELGLGPLTVTPGFRFYQNSTIAKGDVDPRFMARYKLSDKHTLKAGIGRYSQSPEPQELDSTIGNDSLGWIRSIHSMIGWETNIAGTLTSDVQIFNKTWDDDVNSSTTLNYAAETTRYARGLEWFLRYTGSGPMFGWISYTFSETKFKEGEDGKETFDPNDSTHILHLVGNYKLSSSWQIASRFKYQTGYVFTPIVPEDVWYQSNSDTYTPEENPNLIGSKRVPDTVTLTVYGEYESKFEGWSFITRFGVEDYQFNKSSDNISYNYDYSRKEYTTGLTAIPFIELRATI